MRTTSKTFLAVAVLALLAGAASAQQAQAPETVYVAEATPPPVVKIVNHSASKVDVTDGAFNLAFAVMPGETRVVDLLARDVGYRRLTVRGLGWASQTDAELFKNRGYELTIEDGGRLTLNLWTTK